MAELTNNMNCVSYESVDHTTYQSMLLPAPAVEREKESVCNHAERVCERTIAINPQQRSVVLPFSEFGALNKPRCGSLVLSLACIVVIDGRVGRREPYSKFLLHLIPCGCISLDGQR
jgi:hypothetical protein